MKPAQYNDYLVSTVGTDGLVLQRQVISNYNVEVRPIRLRLFKPYKTSRLVPIRFWRMGHGRVVKTLATTVSLRFWGPRFNTGIHLMKQFAHNWYLPCCHCTETCSHVSFIQDNRPYKYQGLNKMIDILEITFSQIYFRERKISFLIEFNLSLYLVVQSSLVQGPPSLSVYAFTIEIVRKFLLWLWISLSTQVTSSRILRQLNCHDV